MAAPSQSSPNQSVQKQSGTSSEATASAAPEEPMKLPPVEASASLASEHDAPPTADNNDIVPTYVGTEASAAYKTAKLLLTEGSFNDAMTIIEEAISKTLSVLPPVDESQVDESLGPLQYLYGTTLLYSVEESDDNPETNIVVKKSGEGNDGGPTEETVGDLEIAWENLESARGIVQNMLVSNPEDNKLKLDLAQIHLRLGDLQRLDGRYVGAISDYTTCLELREPIMGVYNRSVADSRYSLAMVYMMLASEGDTQQEKKKQGEQLPPAVAIVPPEKIEEYRSQSVQHYLSSARSIAGTIALACGSDPDVMTAETTEKDSAGKTTGLDPYVISAHGCSHNLRAIRDRVSSLLNSKGQSSDEEVKPLADMLDEIQEVVDEAQNTKQGLHDVSKMTAKAHAQIAAQDKAEGEAPLTSDAAESVAVDGATTTVGFGASGSAAAAAATAAPMMVVKKKKKKRPEEDAKMPAQDDAKRAKTG